MTQARLQVTCMNSPFDDRRTRPAARRVGTYLPLFAILGIGVPALIYLTVMQTLGWQVPKIGLNGLIPMYEYDSGSVVLYTSPTTRNYFAKAGGNYDTLLNPWRGYFSARRITVQEVSKPEQLHAVKDGVLVLPSAVALSTEERKALTDFRARGGGVLATWASGARNGNGDWEGWKFLESLGVQMVGEMPSQVEAGHLIMNGESPVSHELLAGHRFGMTKSAEPLLRIKGEKTAARFMNWARIPDPERGDEGAIVFSETKPNEGRAAVFAFSESTWEGRPLTIHEVIDDTIRWLHREPTLIRAAWPNGKRAAQVIEMDTEEGFPNALVFARMMKEIDYRATFYVLTSVGKHFPDVLTALHRDFEVGYHADVHHGFKGQPAAQQEMRMQTMRAEMASILPDVSHITGFRAPTEGYDETTELLLQKYGIRHHAADPSRSEARLPLIVKTPDVKTKDSLVVLPRTQRDDLNLASQGLTTEQTGQQLVADFDLAIENGALGFLSVHSQSFPVGGVLTEAMPALLDRIRQRRPQVWMAAAGEVASWWKERERFRLSVTKSGKRLDMNVTIADGEPISGATVLAMLPQKRTLPKVEPAKIGLPRPTVFLVDDYRAAIVFGTLNPGNYTYQVNFPAGPL